MINFISEKKEKNEERKKEGKEILNWGAILGGQRRKTVQYPLPVPQSCHGNTLVHFPISTIHCYCSGVGISRFA